MFELAFENKLIIDDYSNLKNLIKINIKNAAKSFKENLEKLENFELLENL